MEAGHHRKLCSVKPQLPQRLLYCTQAWRRASSKRRRHVRVDNSTRYCSHDRMDTVIEGPEPVVKKGSLRDCGGDTLSTQCKASGHQARLFLRCSGAIDVNGVVIIGGT